MNGGEGVRRSIMVCLSFNKPGPGVCVLCVCAMMCVQVCAHGLRRVHTHSRPSEVGVPVTRKPTG